MFEIIQNTSELTLNVNGLYSPGKTYKKYSHEKEIEQANRKTKSSYVLFTKPYTSNIRTEKV